MQSSKQQGFVLVFALVIMIAVMTVSATIFTIYIKELQLSSVGRESVEAYYAAESGAECALYWFLQGANFRVSSGNVEVPDQTDPLVGPWSDAQCVGRELDIVTVDGKHGFWWNADPSDEEVCAFVWVEQNPVIIKSRGYNTCISSNLQVERGFEIRY